jgi:subtilisin family serine protease
MGVFFLKYIEHDKESILNKIKEFKGKVVYTSKHLPIIGVSIRDELKNILLSSFDFVSVHDCPEDGQLLDVEGSIASRHRNRLTIVPPIPFQALRKYNHTGWGVTVAILDSGIDEDWVSEHYDLTGYGSTPYIMHGTKVANIVKQAAPGSKILSYKVCHDSSVNYLNVLKAVDMAVQKADVINMSLGFTIDSCKPTTPCPLCETINYYSQNMGKVFVAAAGNLGKENSIQCPGNSQEAVTVGSVKQHSLELADYSSRGTPGVKKPNIITSGSIYFNQEYEDGTSFSTPILTGVISALLPSMNKDSSLVKSYVYKTAKDIGLPEHHQGFGLLDLNKLLEVISNDQSISKSAGQEQG